MKKILTGLTVATLAALWSGGAHAAPLRDYLGTWVNVSKAERTLGSIRISAQPGGRILVRLQRRCYRPPCRVWNAYGQIFDDARRGRDAGRGVARDVAMLRAVIKPRARFTVALQMTVRGGQRMIVRQLVWRNDGRRGYVRYVFRKRAVRPPVADLLKPRCARFNLNRTWVDLRDGQWQVVSGKWVLVNTGRDPRAAIAAMGTIRSRGFNQKCVLPGTRFQYWLNNAGLPRPMAGATSCTRFNPDNLVIQQRENRFIVTSGLREVLSFRDLRRARSALAVMQQQKARGLCSVRSPRPVMMYLTQ